MAGGPDHEQLVIDSHVHVFPPDLIQQRDSLTASDRWFDELYSNPAAQLAMTEELLESMDEGAIHRSVMCGFPWSDTGLCREHNDYMCRSRNEHPERLSWLATVVPHLPEAPQEAERCFRDGAAGIGELNADGQGFDLTDPDKLAGLVEVCEAYAKPIMFHVSEPVGHEYPGKGTATPDRFIEFLKRFPDVQVIAAHWGGGLPFYELMPEVARITRNVVYDSAATTYLYRFPVFRTAIELAGARRVLFASDFPVLSQSRLRKRVERLALADDTWRQIAGENAARILRLE